MKRFFILSAAIALFSLLITSCTKNDDNYSLGDIWLSLGFVETENTSGYDFIILNDNGDTLLPTTTEVPYFITKQKQRILVNYTILDEVGTSPKKFYVKINNMREILYKNIVELTPTNADSLGNDPIHVTNIWKSDSLLNVEFQYYGGKMTHFINLAIDEEKAIKLDEPVALNFLHNSNNDEPSLALNGIVTFNLKKLQKEGKDSVEFVVNYIDYQNENHSISGTYKY